MFKTPSRLGKRNFEQMAKPQKQNSEKTKLEHKLFSPRKIYFKDGTTNIETWFFKIESDSEKKSFSQGDWKTKFHPDPSSTPKRTTRNIFSTFFHDELLKIQHKTVSAGRSWVCWYVWFSRITLGSWDPSFPNRM